MGNTFTKSIHSDNTDQTGGSRSISEEDMSTLRDGDVLDIIVSHYILTMNMESLSDLNKSGKCHEITQLTNEAFTKKATIGDILAKYNDMFNANKTEYQEHMCSDIISVYMNIAKIYSVIVSAIRPSYEYKDEKGDSN